MQLIHDVRYFPPLSLFVPQCVAFVLILVISGSQDNISTTSLMSALQSWGKTKKGQGEWGGANHKFQHTLHASYWPEMPWSPSASREAGKSRLECSPDSNEERERTTLLARLQMVSATPGVPSWASYLISLGIYVRLWKMRIKIPTS